MSTFKTWKMDVNRRCEISCVRESLPLYLLYANLIYNYKKNNFI